MFENRVLRSVFGPKKDEVTGEWRKLHNEELPPRSSTSAVQYQGWSRRRGECQRATCVAGT